MKRANEDKTGSIEHKKKKYEQKFLNSWLADPEFKDWLEKRNELPYCKLCECKLSCAKTALKRHKENRNHQNLCRIQLETSKPITSFLGSQARTAARIEIKLSSFIAENNLPLSIVDDLVPLLRDLFPSDQALSQVTLGKQKATNVVRQVLGFYSIQECVAKLKANKFSLIVDETTDNPTTSQLAVLGVYFDEKDFRLEIILIDLIPLKDRTATTIYTSLLESLRERGIPMHNVVGFCADTCNVMFGVHHSVSQLLIKNHPWIIAVKCSCHLIHFCSSYASKTLPKSVEDLCRNIFSHFSLSSKRSEAFKEFQQFVETKELKILRPGKQRKYCVVYTQHAILCMDYIFFSHFLLILDFRLYQVAFNEILCQEDPRELQCLEAILY